MEQARLNREHADWPPPFAGRIAGTTSSSSSSLVLVLEWTEARILHAIKNLVPQSMNA
jgi:hypothetical protein